MEIRGSRECQDCGRRWSYYDTGSVECPDCGSMQSVGVDEERVRHTATPGDLDLSAVREQVDVDPLHRVADAAVETCRPHLRSAGFLHAGDLLDLADDHLAARELLHVADVFGRSFDPGDDEEYYFLALLRGADQGERPAPEAVPSSLRAARGLAYADAVDDYRSELRTWAEDEAVLDRPAREVLSLLREHVKRVQSLQGDVPPRDAETLVAAARALATALREDDEGSLATARERLARLA